MLILILGGSALLGAAGAVTAALCRSAAEGESEWRLDEYRPATLVR